MSTNSNAKKKIQFLQVFVDAYMKFKKKKPKVVPKKQNMKIVEKRENQGNKDGIEKIENIEDIEDTEDSENAELARQLSQHDAVEIEAVTALQTKAEDIRDCKIIWQEYVDLDLINNEDFECITALDTNETKEYFIENTTQCIHTFFKILTKIWEHETIQYTLVMIDDILVMGRRNVNIFHDYGRQRDENVWDVFLSLLSRQNGFIVNLVIGIIAKLACYGTTIMPKADLYVYIQFLKDQIIIHGDKYQQECEENSRKTSAQLQNLTRNSGGKKNEFIVKEVKLVRRLNTRCRLDPVTSNECIQAIVRCFQMILRVDKYRSAFISLDGITTIINILSTKPNFQIEYQLIFCLWVLTFNADIAKNMNKYGIIPVLTDILTDSRKEKVTRIILATYRNLITKPYDKAIIKDYCVTMVQSQVLTKLLRLVENNFDDEDISGDINFLIAGIQNYLRDSNSFDQYFTEVASGRLTWSPVHRSASFWKVNASLLREKNFGLLRLVIKLVKTSEDPITLAVACFDIGEFAHNYPECKSLISQSGGKERVMSLLQHENPNVRYEALLTIQKLMIENWKQFEDKMANKKSNPKLSDSGPAANREDDD